MVSVLTVILTILMALLLRQRAKFAWQQRAALEKLASQSADRISPANLIPQILAGISDSVVLCGPEGLIEAVNPGAARLLGRTAAELVGRLLTDLMGNVKAGAFSLMDTRGRGRETSLTNSTGVEVPVVYTCTELRLGTTPLPTYLIFIRNIGERKLAEHQLRQVSRLDALTRVPNRIQFQTLLQHAIARTRQGGHTLALIYVDLDKFREINDSYGYQTGDFCLETLASRVSQRLPGSALIGRVGGCEFGVLLDKLDPNLNLRSLVVAHTREIQAAIGEPVLFEGHQIYLSTSAGIGIFPTHGSNLAHLIRNAGAALTRAKQQGGGALEVYHSGMNQVVMDRLILKNRLREALIKREFRVHYQPKVNLRDGSIAGAEALLRWYLQAQSVVMPAAFIPLAEESNLIIPIGEWVLEQVCMDIQSWAPPLSPGRLSVNLSLRQLKERDFVDRVQSICQKIGISPTLLELEITESILMDNPTRTLAMLNALKELGIRMAIDDFGTGYSSLSSLHQFPVTTLKIDQSFLRNAAADPEQATLVATIIQMGHSLDLEVVAEGVETQEQLDLLRRLGCDYGQGLLFGGVLSADDFRALLEEEGHTTRPGMGRYQSRFTSG